MRTKELTRIALFAALTAVMSQIIIPRPFSPVPLSLATFGVMLCGILLPPRQAWWSMAAYLLLGGIGLPVFSGFMGGFGRLLGPTGGYLLAYPFAALAAAFLLRRWGKVHRSALLAAALASLICCFWGAVWLSFVGGVGIRAALITGVLPFLPGEAAKAVLAALLGARLPDYLSEL